jgi:hypothetical protein
MKISKLEPVTLDEVVGNGSRNIASKKSMFSL